jgi:large subunit ribosomal protein L10
MPNQQKIETVAAYRKLFEEADSFFVTDYQGLNVADMTALRRKLRESNVRLVIGKNTLFRLAAREASVEGIEKHLEGPTAIAFSAEDPAVAAKILHDSFKEKELPVMKIFSLENELFDGSEIKRLADLPTRDQLYAQVVAAVEAPFAQLVGALDGFYRKLVGTIDALAEKKKTEEA